MSGYLYLIQLVSFVKYKGKYRQVFKFGITEHDDVNDRLKQYRKTEKIENILLTATIKKQSPRNLERMLINTIKQSNLFETSIFSQSGEYFISITDRLTVEDIKDMFVRLINNYKNEYSNRFAKITIDVHNHDDMDIDEDSDCMSIEYFDEDEDDLEMANFDLEKKLQALNKYKYKYIDNNKDLATMIASFSQLGI